MDHDEMLQRFSTPREELDDETRALRERTEQAQERNRAEGRVSTREQFERQNQPIGMDEDYNPFPLRGGVDAAQPKEE